MTKFFLRLGTFTSVLWSALCIIAAQLPTIPDATCSITGSLAQVDLYFDRLAQGHAGLIRVTGDVQLPRGALFNATIHFFTTDTQDGYFALLPVPLEQSPRTYPLEIVVSDNAGQAETLRADIAVETGGFIQQNVIITGEQAALVDAEIETSEIEHIFSIASQVTPAKLWDDRGFRLPIEAALTSPFGAVRLFNGVLETRHTGWDLQAQIGRPMTTTAAGRVAFAGRMNIRGNYVLIDHGHGIFSGYAHLSVIHVTQGQRVHSGQIIGQVGSTGRSSSAHAHFEILVNGLWIDAADFLRLWLP